VRARPLAVRAEGCASPRRSTQQLERGQLARARFASGRPGRPVAAAAARQRQHVELPQVLAGAKALDMVACWSGASQRAPGQRSCSPDRPRRVELAGERPRSGRRERKATGRARRLFSRSSKKCNDSSRHSKHALAPGTLHGPISMASPEAVTSSAGLPARPSRSLSWMST